MLTDICPESSKVLKRFNICRRRGEEKEKIRRQKKDKGKKMKEEELLQRSENLGIVFLALRICTPK